MTEQLASVEQVRFAVERQPLAVLTDMDGTLSPIADRAEEAFVPVGLKEALSELVVIGVRVAVITGRGLDVARHMLDVPGVDFAASHGVDVRIEGRSERPPEVQQWVARERLALAELRSVEGEGVWIEDKEFGLAIHYRQAENSDVARERVLSAIAASSAAREFEVQEGRKIVELRPRLEINKGTAAASLIERYGAAGVLSLGDDITDIDMFRAVKAAATGEDVAAVVVAVRSEEAIADVLANADWWVDGVDGVQWLLNEIARTLR